MMSSVARLGACSLVRIVLEKQILSAASKERHRAGDLLLG